MAIDALRGVALFGVLMVNLVTEFRVSIFAQFLPGAPASAAADRWVDAFVANGLEFKAFSLFSLLFGLGLAVQFERLQRRPDRLRLLLRRLTALLAFGLVHLFLIWNGDILTEYAVAGLMVLPLLYAPRWALGTAAVVLLAAYAAMPLLSVPIPFPSQGWIADHVRDAELALGHGRYAEVIRFNISEVPAIAPLHLFALPRTLGLFALGAWLWRTGVFQRRSRRPFVLAAAIFVPAGFALTLARLHGEGGRVAEQIAPVVLALGYAGAVMALATGRLTRWTVGWAAPLGRTAFSNYILQSVVFGWIFYGYGLGLFGQLRSGPTFLLGVAVFASQALLSALWLRRFRFGPLEWLWRSVMYGQRQPFLRRAAAADG